MKVAIVHEWFENNADSEGIIEQMLPVAQLVRAVPGNRNPVHPVRLMKAAMSTHIVPQVLIDMGIGFKYSFGSSPAHWKNVVPTDFSGMDAF